jgi:hypothetical protein
VGLAGAGTVRVRPKALTDMRVQNFLPGPACHLLVWTELVFLVLSCVLCVCALVAGEHVQLQWLTRGPR